MKSRFLYVHPSVYYGAKLRTGPFRTLLGFGQCWADDNITPSCHQLAKATGQSVRAIHYHIKTLAAGGWIASVVAAGKKHWQLSEKVRPLFKRGDAQ